MKTLQKFFPGLLVPVLFLFTGLASAQAIQQEQAPLPKPKWAMKADKPRAHERAQTAAGAGMGFGKPVNLSGSIWMVDTTGRIVVVMAPNGVPFDLQVTPRTRIEVSDRPANLAELAGQIHKDVLVNLAPERSGDIALSIQVTGT